MVAVNFNTYELLNHSGRGEITVTLFDGPTSAVPDTLPDFIEWATALMERVPAEYKAGVSIAFESGYDGDSDEISVMFIRPETDAEWQYRIQYHVESVIQGAIENENNERLALVALQKKYGNVHS